MPRFQLGRPRKVEGGVAGRVRVLRPDEEVADGVLGRDVLDVEIAHRQLFEQRLADGNDLLTGNFQADAPGDPFEDFAEGN